MLVFIVPLVFTVLFIVKLREYLRTGNLRSWHSLMGQGPKSQIRWLGFAVVGMWIYFIADYLSSRSQ
ncbi:hypothetical protein SAMN06296036_13710 [Pseudobacteriovorax antillogorgiicola]|uniref:Uncharacterized protein n=1 Tax=Pseudobacteriovorax antillogorgiicola TaxID=1513793 RepID=A0A1Y6CQD6_9BACT|nr:hypothetical protein EDD56_11010 [Pseudobacteriovorax antillogorgiicola]SMF81515.1 hypothetical protein SAMN06296036_13710 [Pseudobacteriovorax antillogorgiicola]